MDGNWFIDILAASSTEVLYEPTSEEIVDRMLDIAEVNANDLVYDLGCGDGRIVITAAGSRGARGIGVDHNPERIRESRANARKAKVSSQVHFFEGDLYEWDFSEASVLMLYLLPEANLRLRPKILREMRPGSRVVSHSHGMGGWKADRAITTPGFQVFCWIVPMNACGVWEWSPSGRDSGGRGTFRIQFDQIYQKLFGRFLLPEDAVLMDSEICGERIAFSVASYQDGVRKIAQFEGVFTGGQIEGYEMGETGKTRWTARRQTPGPQNSIVR